MGNAVSDLREEDIAQLRLSQTLDEWLRLNSQFTEHDEKLDDYFFVYSFNSGYKPTSKSATVFPWLPRIFLITSHQLIVLRVSQATGLREERAVSYTDIEDVFFAPAYHLVKLSFTDGSMIYFSTAREDLPEQVVAVVSRNLNTFRNEIVHVMRARQARIARLHAESKAEAAHKNDASEGEATQPAEAENWKAESVVESFYQEQIRELAEVWAELPALGIRELQLWEGSIDLRSLLYTLRQGRRRPLPEDPTSQFLVAFKFIPASAEFGYLEHRVYRVRNDESAAKMVEHLCSKLMVEEPGRFGLRTEAGLELQPDLTFADYGLGTLFLTWKVEMFFLDEQQAETYLVQFMLPDEPEFMGTNKKLMKLTRSTTISETMALMCRKLRIPNDNKYKLQHQGLEVQQLSTLREHGLGSLFDSEKKMVFDVVFNTIDATEETETDSPRSRGNTDGTPASQEDVSLHEAEDEQEAVGDGDVADTTIAATDFEADSSDSEADSNTDVEAKAGARSAAEGGTSEVIELRDLADMNENERSLKKEGLESEAIDSPSSKAKAELVDTDKEEKADSAPAREATEQSIKAEEEAKSPSDKVEPETRVEDLPSGQRKKLKLSKSLATSSSHLAVTEMRKSEGWCKAQPSGFPEAEKSEGEWIVEDIDFNVKVQSEEVEVVIEEEKAASDEGTDFGSKEKRGDVQEKEVIFSSQDGLEKDAQASDEETQALAKMIDTKDETPQLSQKEESVEKQSDSKKAHAERVREKKLAIIATLDDMSLDQLERAEAMLAFKDSSTAAILPLNELTDRKIYHQNFSNSFEMGFGPADAQGRVRLTIQAQEAALKTLVQQQSSSESPSPEVSEFLNSLFDRLKSYGVNPEEVEGLDDTSAAQLEASDVANALAGFTPPASPRLEGLQKSSSPLNKRHSSAEPKRRNSFRSISRVVRRGKKENQ